MAMPRSLESIKCINELLMKRLIPYSYRSVYNLIISTITSIIDVGALLLSALAQTLSEHVSDIPTIYVKRLNVMIFQLASNYISAIAFNPEFDFVGFLRSLVKFTRAQTAPRCYLQLAQIWSVTLDYLLQNNWGGAWRGR